MYPKNAATPPEVDLGQILLIADGTIQTTGVSVRVKIGTGAWGAGAGTASCDATSGIWTYAPTQAETNADYFIVALYKASCTALSKTIVTTASSVAGYAGLDWSLVRAPTTTLVLSGTTIKTATDVETDTADIQSRLPAALVSGRIDASVGAMAANTLTASALATDAVTEIQNGLATPTNITGGTITTVTDLTNLPSIPANWLTASGIAAGAFTSAKFAAGAFDAVWSVAARTLTAISDSSGVTTLLTRIVGTLAAGTHNAQSGDAFARLGAPTGASIAADIGGVKAKTDLIPSDPADASDIAAAFATVNSTLAAIAGYVDTEVAAIKAKTDGLPADTVATLAAISALVDTLETEVAKIIKSGEQITHVRAGKSNVTETITRG